jgi:Encapsulating protein for peroxidase.
MQDFAEVDTGGTVFRGSSGKWAGEQLLKAAAAGNPNLDSSVLRTLDTLLRDEWVYFDTALVEENQIVLQGVADLIAAGLTQSVPNSLGKTMLEYQRITDMGPATVSLDGITRSENDRQEMDMAGLPLPITHKDWYLDLRTLVASRTRGEALDTSNTRQAGRRIAEMAEQMLFQGGKTFGGRPIYGYTTHPNRETASFTGGGAWGTVGKTGAQYLADVLSLIVKAEGKRAYGPYWIYVGRAASVPLDDDFKALGTLTIRQRLMQVDRIQKITVVDQMPVGSVVLVQPDMNTVQWVQGEPLQNVQWDVEGGFKINFKSWQIGVPLIKADASNRVGIVHMS